jgi:uncharacterized protein (DUF2252 family)
MARPIKATQAPITAPAPTAQLPEQSHGRPHAERRSAGKALRQSCPRSDVAAWKPSDRRADPVDLLVANSAGRLPELVPIRYGRMMSSPFAFYRGAAAVMAHDLSFTASTGMNIVACGDCHLVNFGGFATPERQLVFDINDFDETSVAPWEWDVRRLAASFVVAGRANGFKATDCRQAAWQAARSYRENMARYAEMPVLEAYYETIDLSRLVAAGADDELKRLNQKRIRKALAESAHIKEFTKLTCQQGEQPRIRDEPPLIFHNADMQQQATIHADAEKMVADYMASLAPERRILMQRYRFADVAMKVVGVGSVGTYCGVALFVSGNGDPLFLQFKEARPSVLEPYCGRAPFKHHGERVVFGQRLMQAAADAFLGWTTGTRAQHRHYYVRQLRDAKIKPMVELMNPANLMDYAQACGWALARAHKRSGDAVVLSAYMGTSAVFENAMAAFAVHYADQNERDHEALLAAVRAGRIEARVGV